MTNTTFHAALFKQGDNLFSSAYCSVWFSIVLIK